MFHLSKILPSQYIRETIPLIQVADIIYEPAPAQISHENGARRIYVGFNIKGRDVQSTVDEIQNLLDAKLKLPEGYYYTYGGEFREFTECNYPIDDSSAIGAYHYLPVTLCNSKKRKRKSVRILGNSIGCHWWSMGIMV